MAELSGPLSVASDFATRLERAGISYLVSGSIASSVHGEPRATLDVDVVADLRPSQVAEMLRLLEGVYYVSPDAVREAVRDGTSFNAIHEGQAIKVDVFVTADDAFEMERLRCRTPIRVGAGEAAIYIDSPEHSILRKLEWYRRGGEQSDRQWRDVLAMVAANRGQLDRARLEKWARYLGVTDLLERVLDDE